MTAREDQQVRICKRCGTADRGPKGQCRRCERERRRLYHTTEKGKAARNRRKRKVRSAYNQRHREKVRARDSVRFALKSGKLIKSLFCQVCWASEIRLDAHHQDYFKRLEVVWLCTICHAHVHGKANVRELLAIRRAI